MLFLFFSITIGISQREENHKAHGHITSQTGSSISLSLYSRADWPQKTPSRSPVDRLKPCNESYAGSFSSLLIGLTSTCQLWREEKLRWLTDLYGQVILALCVSIVRQRRRRSETQKSTCLWIGLVSHPQHLTNSEQWRMNRLRRARLRLIEWDLFDLVLSRRRWSACLSADLSVSLFIVVWRMILATTLYTVHSTAHQGFSFVPFTH